MIIKLNVYFNFNPKKVCGRKIECHGNNVFLLRLSIFRLIRFFVWIKFDNCAPWNRPRPNEDRREGWPETGLDPTNKRRSEHNTGNGSLSSVLRFLLVRGEKRRGEERPTMEAIHHLLHPWTNKDRIFFGIPFLLHIQSTVKSLLLTCFVLGILSLHLRWTQRPKIAKHSTQWEGQRSPSLFLARATPWGFPPQYQLIIIIRSLCSEMAVAIVTLMRVSLTMLHRTPNLSPPRVLRRNKGTIFSGLIHSGDAFCLA